MIHADEKPPNILLIMADDLGYENIACHGSKLHQTPNIDKLAKDGIPEHLSSIHASLKKVLVQRMEETEKFDPIQNERRKVLGLKQAKSN